MGSSRLCLQSCSSPRTPPRTPRGAQNHALHGANISFVGSYRRDYVGMAHITLSALLQSFPIQCQIQKLLFATYLTTRYVGEDAPDSEMLLCAAVTSERKI